MKKYIFILSLLIWGTGSISPAQILLGGSIQGVSPWEQFGSALDLSDDGMTLAVGGPFLDINAAAAIGVARVYRLVGNGWTQLGNDFLAEAAEDEYGSAISLSGDGRRIAIGGPDNDGASIDAGHVRVFEYAGGVWTQMGGDLDGDNISVNFGSSVSLSQDGSRLAVGAVSYWVGTGGNVGVVQVFEWVNNSWVQLGSNIDGEAAGDFSGESVSFSADGNILAVGAAWNDGNGLESGHVRVYRWANNNWQKIGGDIDGRDAGDYFGSAVSLSADGTRLAVGAPHGARLNSGAVADSGYVQVFDYVNNTWVQLGEDFKGSFIGDFFGAAVSLSATGTKLAIGSPRMGPQGSQNGQVQTYELVGTEWAQIGNHINGGQNSGQTGYAVSLSADGAILAVGEPFFLGFGSGYVRAFYQSDQHRKVSGLVKRDIPATCVLDSSAYSFHGIPVAFRNSRFSYLGFTDRKDHYRAIIDTGLYDVSLDLTDFPYYIACPPSQQVDIRPQSLAIPNVDFVIQKGIICPFLSVSINSGRIRRCFTGTYYVNYCNRGTADAPNAYIEIELDPELSYLSSSIPLGSQTGNVLRFPLGTVPEERCNSFSITVKENCNTPRGYIHCTSAHIFPDTICTGNVVNTRIAGGCSGDTLNYNITNLADDFPTALPYMILDDVSIVDTGSVLLKTGESFRVAYPEQDTSKRYQLVFAARDRNYYQATGLVGCRPDSTSSTYSLQFIPSPPKTKFEDISCTPNRGSFDPNEKQAIPIGPGANPIVLPNAPMEYTIYFQNTGNDTAIFVNLLDTLSTHLDPSGLKVLASSHPYRLEILRARTSGQPILHFEFDPIFLPDSSTNQEGSNGFVRFRILQKPDLPLKTVIENNAAIYFDYNKPIITNTVSHTVDTLSYQVCSPGVLVERVTSCTAYTWRNGKTYTSSNQTAAMVMRDAAANGCDSVIKLDLTITRAQGMATIDTCGAYTWIDGKVYDQSNNTATYTLIGAIANGCDSVVSLNLTIDTLDISVVDLSPDLVAQQDSAVYQWLDCDKNYTLVHGATSQKFRPAKNGNYAVRIYQDGCVDTSACYAVTNVGIADDAFQSGIQVYPNPTDSELQIDLGDTYQQVRIRLLNALGQELVEKQYAQLRETQLELGGPAGIYFLEIQTGDGGRVVLKVVRR